VYEVVRLINVWSSWGKKRERGKKNKLKNLLLPLLHVQRKKKRKNAVQNIIVSGFFVFWYFLLFLYGDPKIGNNNSYAKVPNHYG
jgi:hypothetical protein